MIVIRVEELIVGGIEEEGVWGVGEGGGECMVCEGCGLGIGEMGWERDEVCLVGERGVLVYWGEMGGVLEGVMKKVMWD